MKFIQLKNVSKIFHNQAVLKDITLNIEKGEFVGLLGPSGCGKSTLLSLISGLEKLNIGSIVNSFSQNKSAFVFQEACLMPWRTLEDNIAVPLELLNYSKNKIKTLVEQYLKLLDLRKCHKLYPRELSGGMKMRVSIARALIIEPELLYMDEPFASLDLLLREKLAEELYEIWSQKKWTGIFVTHSISEAVYLCSRVYVFSKSPGTIIKEIKIQKNTNDINNFKTTNAFHEQCVLIRKELGLTNG